MTLTGKDAERFFKKMAEDEGRQVSKSDLARMRKAYESFTGQTLTRYALRDKETGELQNYDFADLVIASWELLEDALNHCDPKYYEPVKLTITVKPIEGEG